VLGEAFIGGEGRGGGAGKAVDGGTPAAAIKARWRPWCAAVTGGRGRGRGWAAPG
jgi:hypothetical protein